MYLVILHLVYVGYLVALFLYIYIYIYAVCRYFIRPLFRYVCLYLFSVCGSFIDLLISLFSSCVMPYVLFSLFSCLSLVCVILCSYIAS